MDLYCYSLKILSVKTIGYLSQCELPQAIMTGQTPISIQYNRNNLVNIGNFTKGKLEPFLLKTVKQLGISKYNYRGTRAGRVRVRHFISQDTNQGVNLRNLQTLPSVIPTLQLTQNRPKTAPVCTPTFQNLIKIKSEQHAVMKGHINLKMCCINLRSLKNKTLAFCDHIISNDFDLVAVTETWLGTSIDKACISELLPSGYQSSKWQTCGWGGGYCACF